MSPPQQSYEPKLTAVTQPTTIRTTIRSKDTINTIIVTLIIKTASSLMLILQILQSAHNSVYSTVFILIHNLITYTTLRNNHLKSDKNTFTMAKSPPKRPESQSNQISSIHCHVKSKIPKKLQQQSSCKMEVTKVNSIMEKLDESDGNRIHSKNSINHFSSLYKSEDEEGTKHRKKTNTPNVVISKKEKGNKHKGGKKRATKKMETTEKRRQRHRCMTLIMTKK